MHVCKVDEQQNKLSVWERYDFIVNEMWEGEHDLSKYPLLKGIDPNQDTYFNEIQTQFLIKELEILQIEAKFEDSRELIQDLIVFVKTIDTHEFIRFVAD